MSDKRFPVDVFAEIYPCVLPGLADKELIMNKMWFMQKGTMYSRKHC